MKKINCALSPSQVDNLYSNIYGHMLKQKEAFDPNAYMRDLFKKISTNSDPETAAKFLQQVPSLILTAAARPALEAYNIKTDAIKPLIAKFKLDEKGFENIIETFTEVVIPTDIKPVVAQQTQLEFSTEEEETDEEIKENTNATARLKTPFVLSGTLSSFLPVDPNKKSEDFAETLDVPRAKINNTLDIIANAFAQAPLTEEFTYQNVKVKVKATNLYAFSQQNLKDLDPTTQKEINTSISMVALGRSQANVTQADKRVILVLSDKDGKNLYFDEEGNITDRANGKLAYQFMRDVRKTAKGYSVADIYGLEEQLMSPENYAKINYNKDVDGDFSVYLEKVKDNREKELEKLYKLREKALGSDVILEFNGLSGGVSSEATANNLPLSKYASIPGASRNSLKTIKTLAKPQGAFPVGAAVITLNGSDFLVKRSSMPDNVADQIAAVMFDPNIPFETKKDFYSQFIPEDSDVTLAYTMRKHQIIPDMVKKEFRIKLYDTTGTKDGFVTEPVYDFTISSNVLKKATPEQLEKGIKEFSDTLKTGTAKNQPTYMSYKSDLLNTEDYLVYNFETKELDVENYIDFLSNLNGYIVLVNADPGFYNKHLLFDEPNKLVDQLQEASQAKSLSFEDEILEARRYAEEKRALENANKPFEEIQFDFIFERAMSPDYRAQIESQGIGSAKNSDSFYYTSSLISQINQNKNTLYNRETAEKIRDMFAGAGFLSEKQLATVNNAINSAFPKVEAKEEQAAEILQKTTEPEMPNPTQGAPSAKPISKSKFDRFGKSGSLDRVGYIADEIGEEDLEKVLDWWTNTKLGKELQKHISLEHAYNLTNSDVFARFIVDGSTLANPDIKTGKIQINKGKGTLVDIYHEAWHGFSQLYLTRKEKYDLYDEVINYKDEKGNQPYLGFSYKDVDELLAEDFRTYMKSNYIKKGSPVRNKIFRKIMNFLRALFGLKPINSTEVITDVMNVPAVRELFEKLNYSSNKKSFVRQYQANVNNIDFFELNRGIANLSKPSESALSTQDSRLVSDSMDMIISDIIDDYYRYKLEKAKETGNYKSLKAGTIGLLLDPIERAQTYTMIQETLQEKLDSFKDKLDINIEEVTDYVLSPEEELLVDNIRILQAALDNYGDPQWEIKGIKPTGTIAYHLENSDYDISKSKYDLDKAMFDEEGNEVDEDEQNMSGDTETPFGGQETNKKSLLQLASKEVIYVLKSLSKIDRDGNESYNRLGFKERADFRKVWNIVTKTIGGVRDRVDAYNKLVKESKNFPELKQLIETKFPDPKYITNRFEQGVSNSFWQTFARPSVKFWQFTVFPQYGTTINAFGEPAEVITGFESDVTQSSIEIDSTIRRFEALFKSSIANKYISKSANNQSILNLSTVVSDFENKKYPGQLDVNKSLKFLGSMGIKLDNLPVINEALKADPEYYGTPYIYDIIKDFQAIQNSPNPTPQQQEFLNKFISNPIEALRTEIPKGVLKSFKKEVSEKNILKRIAELQSQYGYDSANPGVLLPDGNRVFENVNHSQVTVTIDALNRVEKLSDLWEDPSFDYMSHLKPSKSFFTARSKMLGSMFSMKSFEKQGDKTLDLIRVAGTQIADVEGINTSDLDKFGKFTQGFNTFLLSGIEEFIRHAEKKSAFGIRQSGGKMKVVVNGITNGVDQNLYIDLNKFVPKTGQEITDGEIVAVGGYFLDYMATEFDRIRYFKQNPNELLTIKGYNREVGKTKDGKVVRAGEVFAFFDNILTEKTKEEIYKLAEDSVIDLPTYIKTNQDLYLKVQKDIVAYFREKTESLYDNYLVNSPYIDDRIFEKAGILEAYNKEFDNPEYKKILAKAYLFNDWIHKFETFNLINGDLAQFSDATKRAPGSTSDGDAFLNDKYMHNFINNTINKASYAKVISKELGKNYDKFEMTGTLNTGVIEDAERKSIYLDDMLQAWEEKYRKDLAPLYTDKKKLDQEINKRLTKDAKAYKEMKESDGAAFTTFDTYRVLKIMVNDWSIAQESLYQKIIKGEDVDALKTKEFFPIFKLHYYGALANAPIATTAMHKFAVAPIIPTIATKGTQLYNLHLKMLDNNIQYMMFGSGSKVSTLTKTGKFDNIFADDTQKAIAMDAPVMNNQIYLEYLKDVTKVASKLKKEITYPTQKRVLLLDGLFSVGGIINEANKDVADSYLNSVNNYTEILTLELLNKIGYQYDESTKTYTGKLDKFIELIREELGVREVPQHLIELLDASTAGHLSMDFSIHPEADTLEKIIVNRIQKSVVKQKTKGESLVQAPSTFYNGVWDSGFEVLTDTQEIKKYLGTNVLPFYRRGELKDGKRLATDAMKVAIPLNGDFLNLLKLKHTDGEPIGTRDRLNELIKNDAWLEENRDLITIAGPRIPTDAANTMEFAEVWHFIDVAAGNTVIVPTEIVAKAGSDFDVDKIFFMMPNINSDGTLAKAPTGSMKEIKKLIAESNSLSIKERKEKGIPSPDVLINQYKKYAQNKLIQNTREILSLPDNYASLTKPNNTYLVEDQVEFYEKNRSGYNNKTNAHGEPVRVIDGKVTMSPTRIGDIEYNLNQHEANLSGSLPLGIMAKKNKVHTLFKSIGAIMPKSYKATVWNDTTKKYDDLDADYDVVIRMKHQMAYNSKGEKVVSLSHENNVDGEKIGDIFSHGLQGLLDRAKNPFPFLLQIVKEALPTINHLIEAGVGVEEVFAFINNPWISQYIQNQIYLGGSSAKLLTQPIPQNQVNSTAMRTVLNNMISMGGKDFQVITNQLADYANDRRLFDVANMLKKGDLKKEYSFIMRENDGKQSGVLKATGDRMFNTKDFPLDRVIEIKEYSKDVPFDLQKDIYKRSKGITNNDNFYYAAQAAWKRAFGDQENISGKDLKELVEKGPEANIQNLALVLHMIQLEKQFSGMDALEMSFSPDTGMLDTVLQVRKRDKAMEKFDESSKIDSDFLNRLRHKSILSSFYKGDMIMDLVVPLFSLRLNEKVTDFIEGKITRNRDIITQRFGPGVKGQERFTNMYNNAVVNYIFQNTMSNYTDENGTPILLPEVVHTMPTKLVETGPAVSIKDNEIQVNKKQAKEDYQARLFLSSNNTPQGYKATNQDTFDTSENPFPTFASYMKFIVEKEYFKSVYSKESLADNNDYKKFVKQSDNEDLALDKYITQRALMSSFNRAFIMGTTKYSYTTMVMDIINEFEDKNIKENYPVLSQLSPAKFVKEFNIIELNDKATAKGVIADDYYKNLKDLADPTVKKVRYENDELAKIDNKRISDVFKNFSMMMFYQHGAGYSRLGFVKVLDPQDFTEIMINAGNAFMNNSLNDETFEKIYNRFSVKTPYKNYLADPENLEEEEMSVEDMLNTFSDDDLADMMEFMGEEPTIEPSTEPTTEVTETVETIETKPGQQIIDFYNNLTIEQQNILGNLDDLIADYENVPFEYSEKEYIESLKCKL